MSAENRPLSNAPGAGGTGWAATWALLVLALPMIGMTVSRMLVNNIDTLMVGFLGKDALAAINPSTLLLFVVGCWGMGIAQAVQTFASQAEGRGDPRRAGAYVWQSLYIAGAVGLVTAPIALTVPIWFRWFAERCHHPPAVTELEIQFLTVALWSTAPGTACIGVESFFNGIRKPMVGFYAVLASLVTVVVANYLLIFGNFGFPRLGIVGSAVATVLAFSVRFLVSFVPLLVWREIDERYQVRRSWRPDWSVMRPLLAVGAPTAVQWIVDLGAWVIFLEFMMPRFGEVPMAAATIAIQCMHLSFMPALGVGQALTTQVGNAIGAGLSDAAVRHVTVARRVIVSYMGLMALVFIVAGESLAWIFSRDPAVISAAAHVLIWCALFQLSDAICVTYSFALRGAGDTRAPAVLFGVCCWGIFVGGGYLAVTYLPHLGPDGPWIMCMSYIIVLSVLLWLRFRSGKWRDIRLFGNRRDEPALPLESAEAAPVLATTQT